jgi:hypothetical protein
MIDELFQKMFLDRFFPPTTTTTTMETVKDEDLKKNYKEKLHYWKQQLKKINNQF